MRRILNSPLNSRKNRVIFFENVDEIDSYWKGSWETEAKENLDADWIKEVEDSVGQTLRRKRSNEKSLSTRS